MTLLDALRFCEILIGIALFLQSIELLASRSYFSESGIWRWSQVRSDLHFLGKPLLWLFDLFLEQKRFVILLYLRMILSLVLILIPDQSVSFFLAFSTILISIRFRGIFNGGSDYMSLIVITSVAIGRLFDSSKPILIACIGYIAVQVTLSYFTAGIIKLFKTEWRNGSALRAFLNSSIYRSHPLKKLESKNNFAFLIMSWGLVIFEVSFPIGILSPDLLSSFIVGAIIFHLLNWYVFGLNRFFWAWLSAYPALFAIQSYLF